MNWNPWHGCEKVSAGCANCFVFMLDRRYGRDTTVFSVNQALDLPIRRGRNGEYKLWASPYVFTCSNSDFFLPAADHVRGKAWEYIKERSDLNFLIPTKRVERIAGALPADWNMKDYGHVYLSCSCENQEMADARLPVYLGLELPHYTVQLEPLIGAVDLSKYLERNLIEKVTVEGEFGKGVRPCHEAWVRELYLQCRRYDTNMAFRRAGDILIDLDNAIYPKQPRGSQDYAGQLGYNYESTSRETVMW